MQSIRQVARRVPARAWWAGGVSLLALYPLVPSLDMALDTLLGLPVQLERLLLSTFVFALLTVAVHVQLGMSGLMQLGAAAFYGVGAYTLGMATVVKLPFQCSFGVALLACAVMGAACGAVLGLFCGRVEGDALAMVTLSFAEVVRALLLNADGITDGSRGLNPVGQPSLPGAIVTRLGGEQRATFVALYWLALAVLALVAWLVHRLSGRRFGRALTAMRSDPLAAATSGLSVVRLRMAAMALGGGIAALGGGLYAAYLTTTAEPSTYDYNVSVMALSAVVLGGLGSLRGALFGAAAVVGFDAALSPIITALTVRYAHASLVAEPWANFANWRWLVFGSLLVATMRWRPQGLAGRRT